MWDGNFAPPSKPCSYPPGHTLAQTGILHMTESTECDDEYSREKKQHEAGIMGRGKEHTQTGSQETRALRPRLTNFDLVPFLPTSVRASDSCQLASKFGEEVAGTAR